MQQASSHLLSAWRCENGTSNAGSQEPVTYESSKTGFMARSAAANDRDIAWSGNRRRVPIDDLIIFITEHRRICKRGRME